MVILIDATPAAALSCYGYERETTPNIDQLSQAGLRFDNAYAPASYTLASISSIFTGLAPAAHGVIGLQSNVIADEHWTLAENLQAAGFATGGFSSNPHITPEGGFSQGFDEFRHYGRDRFDLHDVPEALREDPVAWWRAHEDERRFLYVHFLPPHQPYDAPPAHAKLFGTDRETRRLGMTDWLVEADREGTVRAGSEEAKIIRSRFDAGLHHADAVVGDMLNALDLGPNTLLVLLSDHGEAFAEHGRLLHGSTVFEEMCRVPLIISGPGIEPGLERELTTTSSLAPTLCQLLDVPWLHPLQGTGSFAGVFTGEQYLLEPTISRSVGNVPVWSLRTNEWSLIEQPARKKRLLFDRDRDRGETQNLLGPGAKKEHRQVAEELSEQLQDLLSVQRQAGKNFKNARNDTHREAIEKLGYFGDD